MFGGRNKSASTSNTVSMHIRGCLVSFPYQPYKTQVKPQNRSFDVYKKIKFTLLQISMMDKTLQALKNSQNVLLELPTGSGKSLSLLCAAAAWLESVETPTGPSITQIHGPNKGSVETSSCAAGEESLARHPRVFIASRTHSQLAQLVRELRKSKYTPQMCILGENLQHFHRSFDI